MTDTTIETPEKAVEPGQHGIAIRTITTDQSGAWLQAGWRDFKRTPAIGLTYGALCTIAGWLIVLSIFQSGQLYLTLPLAAGFMLLAPLVAVGLYETSRRLEMGENVTLWHSLNGFRRNPGQIGAIGVLLMLFFLAWTRIAMLLFALFYNGTMPSLDVLIWQTFFSRDAITFLMKLDGVSFTEAIERLADKAGVQLRREDGDVAEERPKGPPRQRLVEANRLAQEFYAEQLLSPDGAQARAPARPYPAPTALA